MFVYIVVGPPHQFHGVHRLRSYGTPAFICGDCCLFLQSTDCGAMMMLAPGDILSGWAEPLSARKMSSKARLFFLYDPSE